MPLLHELALLYLAMAQSADGSLSNAEREAVTDNLARHFDGLERAEVQNVVLEALAANHDGEALRAAARQAVRTLGPQLSEAQKAAVLQDLVRIARADGVFLDSERALLATVAERWSVALPREAVEPSRPLEEPGAGGALPHLAFLYLVLAHAPDHELSAEERLLILKKLRQWRPALDEGQVRAVLDQAMERYAHGPDPGRLAESVEALKMALPEAQRRAALRDLVQIANADGVFLDSEEDLLNDLVAAWNLDAYADPDEEA